MRVIRGGPGAPDGDGRSRRTRTWWEVMHPAGSEGSWRDLPRLLGDSFRLVWQAGRREFLVTAGLQLVTAAGTAAQLFISKAVIVVEHGSHDELMAADGLYAELFSLQARAHLDTESSRRRPT
jgi:hypothetical protein